ncbi:hypothetical protein N2152v2_000518 [Parachlorella kessleri]
MGPGIGRRPAPAGKRRGMSGLLLTTLLGACLVLGWAELGGRQGLPWGGFQRWQGRSLLEVPLSSIECDRAGWRTRTCRVRNLYVAGAMALFVAEDPNVVLPEARLWEYADIEGKDPTRPAIPLNRLLHIVSQEQAAALLGARLAQGASNGGGGSRSAGPLDQGGGTAGTAAAGAAAAAGTAAGEGGGGRGYMALDTVVGLQPFLLQNWWHTMDDVSVTAFRFCKYFGRCRYEDLRSAASGIALINAHAIEHELPDWPGNDLVGWPFYDIPGPAIEAFSCYGSLLRLEELPLKRLQEEAAKPLVVIREILFGVGDEITHPYMAKPLRLQRASDAMRLQQIEVLRQCAGLPQENPPRRVPNLRIINREYGAGRSFLGLAEVLAVLDKRRPAGLPFNVEVVYPTGFNFTQQDREASGVTGSCWAAATGREHCLSAAGGAPNAAQRSTAQRSARAQLFDSTDILVIGHGAAAGTMVFLPRRAVVLNLAALDVHRGQEGRVVEGLPKPAFQVTYVKLLGDCERNKRGWGTADNMPGGYRQGEEGHFCSPVYMEPMADKLRTHEGFLALPPQDQAHLLLHPQKNDTRTLRIVRQLFKEWHWAMFYFVSSEGEDNIRTPVGLLVNEMLNAVRLWYGKQDSQQASR